ncbi:MAG: hypothetical protein K0S37_3640 [Microbacterium sp.]|nr:hypothetical protein [Microbacterium sp.]
MRIHLIPLPVSDVRDPDGSTWELQQIRRRAVS